MKISDKFNKHKNKKTLDSSKDEKQEEFLGDSLNESKKNSDLDDSNNSSKNISSDKLVIENIQRSLDLIQLIMEEIDEQEKQKQEEKNNNKKKTNRDDTENTTTIMQDIDIINRAVGDNIVANQEDSFLNSMCSDVNVSKFEENAVKYSVSASILEEKENKIRELKQIIEGQNNTLTQLQKEKNYFKSESKKLQKSLDEKSREEEDTIDQKVESPAPAEVDPKTGEKFSKKKLYQELVHEREKVDKQDEQLREKDMRISELELQVHSLERAASQNKQQLNQIMGGIPMHPMGGMMGGYMVPDTANGALQTPSYTPYTQSMASGMDQSTLPGHNSSLINAPIGGGQKMAPPPSFFSRKVVKPIRGGGKKKQTPVAAADPYSVPTGENKEFNNIIMKTHKPAPAFNAYTPVVRPNQLNENINKQKSFKQMRRESKKSNYLSKLLKIPSFLSLLLDGLKQAKKMLLDESVNHVDESINIDPNSDSDESDEDNENMLDAIDIDPNAKVSRMYAPGMTPGKPGVPSKTIDLMSGMNAPDTNQKEKSNPFKPKKEVSWLQLVCLNHIKIMKSCVLHFCIERVCINVIKSI